jgi:hypothetical protein
MSFSMVHVHVNGECPCPWCMSSPWLMSMFMVQVYFDDSCPLRMTKSMLTVNDWVYSACPRPCFMSMSMTLSILHVNDNVHSACPCPNVHVHVHAACPYPCCMFISMLLSISMLPIRAQCPCFMNRVKHETLKGIKIKLKWTRTWIRS